MLRALFILSLVSPSCQKEHVSPDTISYTQTLSNHLEIASHDLNTLKKEQPNTFARVEKQEALIFQDLKILIVNDFSVEAIIAIFKHTNTNLELSSRDIIDLELLGIEDNLLIFLLRRSL